MGRYYHGDIEGKFWFGVQDSRDAEHFGGEETPIIEIFEDEDGNKSTDQVGSTFSFTKSDLAIINHELERLNGLLGEAKEMMDEFFSEREYYNRSELKEYLNLEGEDVAKEAVAQGCLVMYARILLGEKIKACIEEKGSCTFDADFY